MSTDHSEEMTEQELLAIEARANLASPGPWCVRDQFIETSTSPSHLLGVTMQRTEEGLTQLPGEDNALFIAHARTDIPRLVSEIRRLKSQLRDQPNT